jgi:hypothetical protein
MRFGQRPTPTNVAVPLFATLKPKPPFGPMPPYWPMTLPVGDTTWSERTQEFGFGGLIWYAQELNDPPTIDGAWSSQLFCSGVRRLGR